MEVFKSKYLQIEYDAKNNICIANWTEKTEKASHKEFKEWNIELVNKIQEKKPNGLLANTLDYKFIIDIELQEWSVSNVFEQFAKAGLTKIAMIVPKELIAEMSLEQFADEHKEETIETKYFDNKTLAKKWLVE